MLRTLRFAAALLVLPLPACHNRAPVVDADPALWVVRDADTTIYLFGTIHMLDPDVRWFDGDVREAFNHSGTLVLELVAPPPAEMQALAKELGTAGKGPPLSEQLPPRERARYTTALAQLGLAPNALDRDEPWLAATILSVLPLERLGYSDRNGAEAVLARSAQGRGIPVIGLETAREQLGFLDALSQKAQMALLISTIDNFDHAGDELKATIAAWSEGDAVTLARLLNDDLHTNPELERAMLVQRNQRWADWIARRLETPGTVFVAVGAGHLAGPQSVQAALLKRGVVAARIPN